MSFPQGHIKFADNTPISPKTHFMSPCAKLTSGCIIRGLARGDDADDMGALYAYTYIHMYLSCLYVIIQLNGQRHVAHVARDRRTVFAGETLLLSLSLFNSLSLSLSIQRKMYTRLCGSGKIRSNSSLVQPPLSCRLRAHLNKY